MIGRRRLLGAAAVLGLAPGRGGAVGRLLAQEAGSPKGPGTSIQPDERVNRILESARTGGRRLPGMIGAVVRGEEVTALGAVGIRKIGSDRAIRPDDVVHLGSCTKAMTATMIGTVVDEGKLGWESTLAEVFPDRSKALHPDYRRVTLAQLLAHRAGLPADVDWWDLERGRAVAEGRRRLLTRLQAPPESRPGTKYGYSNVGYVLAGLMAERATGSSWEDLIRRRLFGPLGMASAGFGPPGTPGQVDQPWGHRSEGGVLRPNQSDNPPVMGPAGTVHSSVLDWARFAILQNRGSVGGVRPIRAGTLRALQTPAPGGDYAGGWIACERSWAGGRALTHSGSNTAWYCTIWLAPARDLAFLVAINAGSDGAAEASDEAIAGLVRYAGADRPVRR